MSDAAVILLSGGMDSGVLLAWASQRYREVHALSFDYGSKHAAKELVMAEELAQAYQARFIKVALPFMDELFSSSLLKSGEAVPEGSYAHANMISTVVPFRNGIMLSIAIGYAENHKIDTVLIRASDGPAYQRYLENYFRKRYKLDGTPVRIVFREGENPYAGRKKVFTKEQQQKARRRVTDLIKRTR